VYKRILKKSCTHFKNDVVDSIEDGAAMRLIREVFMRFSRPIVIWILLALVLFGLFAGGKKENEVWLTPSENEVVLDTDWSFSWRFVGDEIEFTLQAPTTGWISIGFDPSRMMKDAQYIIGYVSNGTVAVRDDYGTDNTKHASDTSLGGTQDVRVVSGTEVDGKTTVVFAIPKDSGDAYDKVLIPGSTYTVLIAYGSNGADNFTSMHRAQKSVEVKF
jgi:hypothetical protein